MHANHQFHRGLCAKKETSDKYPTYSTSMQTVTDVPFIFQMHELYVWLNNTIFRFDECHDFAGVFLGQCLDPA